MDSAIGSAMDKIELMQLYINSPYLQFEARPDCPEEGDEQTRFIEDNWTGVKVLISGNGAGKSECASFAVAKFLYSTPPPSKICPFYIVSQDKETVGKIWMQKLSKYITEDQIENIWWAKRGLYPDMILLKKQNGNQYMLYFMSASQGREALQAVDAAGFWVDEQVPEDIILELLARCRTYWLPNSKYYTCTPLKPDAWLSSLWENRETEEVKKLYHFYRMNAIKNEYISQEYKDTYYPTLTPEQRATRVFGDFCNYSGIVYKYFTGDLIIDPIDISKADKYLVGVDMGYRNCAALKIAGIGDKWYIFDEILLHDQLAEELAAEVKGRNFDYRYKTIVDTEDPASTRRFNSVGINTIPASKNVIDGIEYISNLMYAKKLFIFKSCRQTILQLKTYQWSPVKDGHEVKDSVLKVNDHLPDCVRYALYTMRNAEVKPWQQLPSTKINLVPHRINPLVGRRY